MPNSRPDLPDEILPTANEKREIAWAAKIPSWAEWLPYIGIMVTVWGLIAIWMLSHSRTAVAVVGVTALIIAALFHTHGRHTGRAEK